MKNSIELSKSSNAVLDGFDFKKFNNLVEVILKNKIMDEEEKTEWLGLVTVMDWDDIDAFDWTLKRQIIEYNDYMHFEEFMRAPVRDELRKVREEFKKIIH